MSLRKKAIAGTVWSTGASLTKVLIQIVRLSILTRILEKSDFGLVAIVTVVLGFTQLFTDMGVSVALFSRNDLTIKQRSGLYWISILLAAGLYLLLVAFTPVVVAFYDMPELSKLLPLMGLDLIISAASRQFKVYKQKDFQFRQVALIDIITTLASLGVAWTLALRGWGVYSLVWSALFASLTSSFLIIASTIRKHPLLFCLNFRENLEVYKIGAYQLGSQILDYFSNQIDILLIGKVMDVSELGVYNLIKQLANRVYTLLSSTITTVATPLLAKVKDDHKLFKSNYLKFLDVTAFVSVGVFGGIFVCSEFLLNLLYGSDYRAYYQILQIISVFMSIALFVSGASRLIIISGKTDIGFRWTIIRFLVNPLFIYVGSYFGLIGIVISQLIYMVLFFPVYYFMVVTKVFSQVSFFLYSNRLLRNIGIAVVVISPLTVIGMSFEINYLFQYSVFVLVVFMLVFSLLNRNTIISLIGAQNNDTKKG